MIDATETDFPDWLTDPQGPLGPDAVFVCGEPLRQWGLSEVWRLQLGGPEPRSVIVKRGTGEMAEEARRYRELVVPLGIAAAGLLAAQGGDGQPVVLVLEDVGPDTLEQRPTVKGYEEAARTLARMRAVAARRLAQDPVEEGIHAVPISVDWIDELVADARSLAGQRPDE